MGIGGHRNLLGAQEHQGSRRLRRSGGLAWLAGAALGPGHLEQLGEEAFNQFGQERLGPAMAKAGVQGELRVTFHPAHEVYLPQAVTITG